MKNPNHPLKGSSIKAEPIRQSSDIRKVAELLHDNNRNLCLFVLGCNTALRASDLVKLRVNQVRHLKPGDELILKEQKRGRHRQINLTKRVIDSIHNLLNSENAPEEFLFTSRKYGPLTTESIHRLVKGWCRAIGIHGNYGSHTLRKTFGYQKYHGGVPLSILTKMFGHKSEWQTLEYCCIQPETIRAAYVDHEVV